MKELSKDALKQCKTMRMDIRDIAELFCVSCVSVYHAAKKERVFIRGMSETICWDCQHACGTSDNQCAWASKFEPVQNWDALPVKIINNKTKGERSYTYTYQSYLVFDCPQFKKDKPRKVSVFDKYPIGGSKNDLCRS